MKTEQMRYLPNNAGFSFIGVDAQGVKHECVVARTAAGLHKVSSSTCAYLELVGWHVKGK